MDARWPALAAEAGFARTSSRFLDTPCTRGDAGPALPDLPAAIHPGTGAWPALPRAGSRVLSKCLPKAEVGTGKAHADCAGACSQHGGDLDGSEPIHLRQVEHFSIFRRELVH